MRERLARADAHALRALPCRAVVPALPLLRRRRAVRGVGRVRVAGAALAPVRAHARSVKHARDGLGDALVAERARFGASEPLAGAEDWVSEGARPRGAGDRLLLAFEVASGAFGALVRHSDRVVTNRCLRCDPR
jgi:hypothetical protein